MVVTGKDVGGLGHEVHTAEHDVGGLVVVRREAGELEGVAPHVGPVDDLVALVVVPEDQEAWAELGLGGTDPGTELFRVGLGVAVRQGCLQSQHGIAPSGEGLRYSRRVTAWSPHRGVVGLGTDMWPE